MNAIKAKKHLYDHIVYDSDGERKFAAELDTNRDVAETKGSMRSMQLRLVEQSKSEHFKAISGENVVHEAADSDKALLEKVMR